MKLLRMLMILLATFFLVALTAVFLDPTDAVRARLLFVTRLQFMPAVLSLTALSWTGLAAVAALLLLTALFGRVYCAVMCPLGILQDLVAFLRRRFPFAGYAFRPARTKTRVAFLVAFLAAGLLGLHFAFLEPYGIYSRAVTLFLLPLTRLGANALVAWCHQHALWCVRPMTVVVPALGAGVCAGALLVAVGSLAAARGRLWCNTVCPVGTLLGFVSRFSWRRARIRADRCVACGLCARACKAACIDVKAKTIDTSRCVVCLTCAAVCKKEAIQWK